MTAAIGAALPQQGAQPSVDGALVDPAAALPFLAALAAAVAAPIAPPIPVPLPVAVVAPDQADSDGGAEGELSGATGDGVLVDGAAADSAHPLALETERTPGTRRRVLIAELAAPEAPAVHAAPRAAVPRAEAPTTTAVETEAAPSPDTAVGNADRAERAATLPVPAVSPAPTPSPTMWQAALQAQPAPTRTASADPQPGREAPPAAPLPTTASTGGESGRPSANATSVAAGVLAAMHAAHVAQADGARASAPMVQFAEQAVAALTTQGEASAVTENAGDGVPAGPATQVVDAGDPAPLPTPQRVLVSARPASPQGEHDTTGDHRQDAPGEERQLVATPPSEGVEAPVSMARGPWPGSETPTLSKRVDVATPTTTVHQTTEPPAAPPSPTSQVTIELDAERTGVQRVRVAVRGDVVHATLVTDRGGVEAMRPQLDDLRHALEGQGFREAHVQVRMASDGTPTAIAGATAELRLRSDAPSRAPDGSSSEQQPRGRHRGQEEHPPAGGQPEFEEELL